MDELFNNTNNNQKKRTHEQFSQNTQNNNNNNNKRSKLNVKKSATNNNNKRPNPNNKPKPNENGSNTNNKKPIQKKPGHSNDHNNNKNISPILFFLNSLNNLDIDDINDTAITNQPIVPVYVCPGKICDHDIESKNVPPIPERLLSIQPNYKIILQDLIDLGGSFHCQLQKNFNGISLERLANLYDPLNKLRNIIGMKIIKENFAEQIVYFLLDFEPNPAELLHTILEGPPGVGKTLVVDILAEIYLKMGYLTKNVIKKVKINDLKGKYIGHTAPLTQKAIDDAMGGILVIDEAYSLGSAERLDSFSKEIIDTLNRNLTERAGKFICIIAGYGEQIDKCLFAHNEGLRSRFRFRFTINTYDSSELKEIFRSKVINDKWLLHENINELQLLKFFTENYSNFKYFGRDMETLLFHAKVSHCNRIFFEPKDAAKKLTLDDIKIGYQRFIGHNKIAKDEIPISVRHIYT